MAVLYKNKVFIPFLGDKLSIVKGLDPLGLQNASARTYSQLLPGLNNVTDRVRYYSFYCWLLGAYARLNGSTDPLEQKKFIRKAEYVIALMSQLAEDQKTGIPGINYASRVVKQDPEDGYDLVSGTYNMDGTTIDTYWNASSGAFGQYYIGALRQIGIIGVPDNHSSIYARTSNEGLHVSGKELQEAFSENIPPEKQELFFDILSREKVRKEELKELLPEFDLTQIPDNSQEQQLLTKLLSGQDYPTKLEEEAVIMRQQTIKFLLQFLQDGEIGLSGRAFTVHSYRLKGQSAGADNDCLLGWYYYQLNEYWQFACTAILNGLLGYLEKNAPVRWMDLSFLLINSTDDVLEQLSKQYDWIKKDTKISQILQSANEFPEEFSLYLTTKGQNEQEEMASAFQLIWKIYEENRNHLAILKSYGVKRGLGSDQDAVTFFLQFHIQKEKDCLTFIREFLYKNILQRHQLVAFRKMGGGTQSTQKFILEEGHIRYLGNFDPGFTGPRINNLIGFLRDLHIVDAENQITENGQKLLEEYAD